MLQHFTIRRILKNTILFFLIFIIVYLLYESLLEDIIPHSRSWFRSYESFVKHTERAGFCKELPDSAHDMKYYVYEGFLVDKCGYKATFTMEDYEQFKAERLQMYRGFSETNSYCYAEETKRYANLQDMEKVD